MVLLFIIGFALPIFPYCFFCVGEVFDIELLTPFGTGVQRPKKGDLRHFFRLSTSSVSAQQQHK